MLPLFFTALVAILECRDLLTGHDIGILCAEEGNPVEIVILKIDGFVAAAGGIIAGATLLIR